MTTSFGTKEWDRIQLVVFDVDGTLYDQRPLRLRMARDLALHTLRSRSTHVPRILARYRTLREELGGDEVEDFETRLLRDTASVTGSTADEVRAVVTDWIHARPLPYLAACRYSGVAELFDGLRRRGKVIGVLSDYPAAAKLSALGLHSDLVVTANDENVAILKPHPRGLEVLMRRAGVLPSSTLLIGDRIEKDGEAARRADVDCLIRSSKSRRDWQTFSGFCDPIFSPMLSK